MFGKSPQRIIQDYKIKELNNNQRLTATLLLIYIGFQLLFPLRHFLYSGNVSWTEEGHNFSWHMKLRDKNCNILFFAYIPELKKGFKIYPRYFLTKRQTKKMSSRPHMILQFSHHLAKFFRKRGYKNVEIYTSSICSLNGRKPQSLINPTVNLAKERLSILSAKWILPLKEPLQLNKKRGRYSPAS